MIDISFRYLLLKMVLEQRIANTKCQVSKRYGYIYVDVHDDFSGTLARYPKKSFWWYQKVIATNGESLNDI